MNKELAEKIEKITILYAMGEVEEAMSLLSKEMAHDLRVGHFLDQMSNVEKLPIITTESVAKKYGTDKEIQGAFLLVCASGTTFIEFRDIRFYNWDDENQELYLMFENGSDVNIENVCYESGKAFQEKFLEWRTPPTF